MLLLALVGVAVEDIAADYALSAERLAARYAARGEPDQGPLVEAFLADRGTSGGRAHHDAWCATSTWRRRCAMRD